MMSTNPPNSNGGTDSATGLPSQTAGASQGLPATGTVLAGSTGDPILNVPGQQPSETLNGANKDSNDTHRVIAMSGVILCAFFQVFALADGDVYFLAAVGALLGWFFYAGHVAPLYIFFVGDLIFRLGMISRYRRSAFRDFSADDFLFHLFDSVTFVGLIALAFIHFELRPKRLFSRWQTKEVYEPIRKNWHMFEPFSGLLVRLPLAIAIALIVYFVSGQIQSPLEPRLLATQFAQAYIVILILFAVFLLVRTLIDVWSWKILGPEQARFYIRNQIGRELELELNDLRKPGWSRIDHSSAVGGMFLVQWIVAMFMSAILIINARISGNVFMWPAVSALFVFLTAFYNSIRAARTNIAAEQHIIAMVGFVVVIVVGFRSQQMQVWPWAMLFYSWWCFNALIILRMSYLWLLDEHFARKNGWERAKPFSIVRTSLIVIEGAIAGLILYIVGNEMLAQIMYGD